MDEKTEKPEKKTTPKPVVPDRDRIPVNVIRFAHAYDFRGGQKDGLTCEAEINATHTSYVCSYLPAMGMFEVTIGVNGSVVEEVMIPRECVKHWKRFPAA